MKSEEKPATRDEQVKLMKKLKQARLDLFNYKHNFY